MLVGLGLGSGVEAKEMVPEIDEAEDEEVEEADSNEGRIIMVLPTNIFSSVCSSNWL